MKGKNVNYFTGGIFFFDGVCFNFILKTKSIFGTIFFFILKHFLFKFDDWSIRQHSFPYKYVYYLISENGFGLIALDFSQ